jgi:hypothetical protein
MWNKFDRLVVLQTKAQSKDYQNNCRKGGDIVLPIGPEAMYETDMNGWAFCSLGDLWSKEQFELEKEISNEKLDKLIRMLNDYSCRSNPELDLEMGNYYAFQLWVIINQIRHNNFIVSSIAENLKPDKVLCYTKTSPQTFMNLRPDPDCLFAEVLSKSSLYQEGRCEIQKINEGAKINTLRERVLSLIPLIVRELLRKIRNRNLLKNTNSPAYNLLVIGGSGDWIKLNNYSDFNKVFRLHFSPDLKLIGDVKPDQEIIDIINSSIQCDGMVPYDLSDLAIAIKTDYKLFVENAKGMCLMMNKMDAVVTAVLTFPKDNFLAHMAAKVGRPVIVWQHGEKGQSGFDPVSIYTELFYATDYFAYAPVVAEQYQAFVGKYRLKNVVAVGSIEKHVAWRGGNTIVYATGKWFKTTLPIDPDRRLYCAHKSILDYLDSIGDQYSVTIKANNTPGLNDIPYRYSNLRIEFAKPFTELLKTAKVIILDTPATTLVEACSTKVPIFVLGGRTEYTQEFLLVIKRRVVWSETPQELLIHLAAFLEKGIYDANVNDQSFLIQYGAGNKETEVAKLVRDASLNCINYAKKIFNYESSNVGK